MKFLSVCSGIEAASVAWNTLGWKAVGFSEIDPFPCSVLKHYYPEVTNYGDLTRWKDWINDVAPFELLAGGTPCQGFSVAGRRQGMDDPRSQLAWDFLGIAGTRKPRWVVWENVPGVLSSARGRDFAGFIQVLVELGYGLCWRVLDARFFGVAQRRRRVFLVGYLGDWRPPGAVLFERESLRGGSTPSEDEGEEAPPIVASTLRASGVGVARVGNNRGQDPVVPWPMPVAYSLCTSTQRYELTQETVIPFTPQTAGKMAGIPMENGKVPNVSYSLRTRNIPGVCIDRKVRRLTPVECERLQGFDDGYTNVPFRSRPAADTPRYKALGNSWAVPCARWVGERISIVEGLMNRPIFKIGTLF